MPALVPHYTAEEIRRFPDDHLRFEVIRGELFVTPAPGTPHQRAVRDLCLRLQAYLEAHALGEALPAPYEVQFSKDTAVQPDVIVILESNQRQLTAKRFYGPPALVIEIVSYASKRTDRLQKRELYQTEAVPEYWVVDIERRQVERWGPSSGEPDILTAELAWQPRPDIPPLRLNLPDFFAKVARG